MASLTTFRILFAVIAEEGECVLIQADEKLLEKGVFDGYHFSDNINGSEGMPTEPGIYKATLLYRLTKHRTECGDEYEADLSIDDVEKIEVDF